MLRRREFLRSARRNKKIKRFSALPVRTLRFVGSPDENRFARSRTGKMVIHLVSGFDQEGKSGWEGFPARHWFANYNNEVDRST